MKSFNNNFRIMEILLKNNENEIALSEIIKRSGLKRATAARIVASLKKNGYLSQYRKKGKYSIGPRLIYLNGLINQKNSIKEIAHPLLVKLSSITGETAALISWDGKRIFIIEEVHTKHPLKIISDAGFIYPLYSTAAGKIFLAKMNEQELNDYFNKISLHSFTLNTIVDINIIKKHIINVARESIAIDNEEHYQGVRSIAANINNTFKNYSLCVSILGPSIRLTHERITEIMPAIKQIASEISEKIGYKN